MPPKLACERFQFSYSEAYIAATIKHGGRPQFKAHSMPAWEGVLSDEDVADLVAYIVSIGDITGDVTGDVTDDVTPYANDRDH